MFLRTLKKGMVKTIKALRAKANFPDANFANNTARSDSEHLEATIEWLKLGQDVTKTGGVSSHFDLAAKTWGKPYRETTGYIIETFINYFHSTGREELLERARKMGNWEISVQSEDGSFGEIKSDGSVGKKIFNTGQIIIGLIALYKETGEEEYLRAAEKAANWLIKNQDQDGSWKVFITQGPRTYDSRVAWSLLQVYGITKKQEYLEASQKNIRWVMEQQNVNYWFDNTSLSENDRPWTHLIAYTISGLLECYLLLGKKDTKIFDSFYGPANVLLEIFQRNGGTFLPCSFDKNWQSKDKYTCLTGDAQLAIIWMQIYELTGEKKFLDAAHKIIEMIKKTQILETKHDNLRGGILGSSPINGDYAPFMLINWAAKFFADALILKNETKI